MTIRSTDPSLERDLGYRSSSLIEIDVIPIVQLDEKPNVPYGQYVDCICAGGKL